MFATTNIENRIEDVRELPQNRIGQNRFDRALKLWESKNLPYAQTWFENTLDEDPDLGEAHIYLGNIYVYKGKFSNAIEEYNKAEKFINLRTVARINKIIVHTALKEMKPAQKLISELSKANADDINFLAVVGWHKLIIGQYDESISLLEKSTSAGVCKKEPYIDLIYLYLTYLRDYQRALDFIKNPSLPIYVKNDPFFLNNFAYALIKTNNLEEAEKILTNIATQNAGSKSNLNFISTFTATKGLYEIYKNNFEKGNSLYLEAKKDAPADKKPLVEQKRLIEIGYYYLRNNQLIEAEGALKKALQIETPINVLDYSQEALEYLEEVFRCLKIREFTEGYVRLTSDGVAIEVPVSRMTAFLSILNKVLTSRNVSITLKTKEGYKIIKFLSDKWQNETRNLKYYFLLSSTLIEWRNASLYSAANGNYFLEFEGDQNMSDETLYAKIREGVGLNEE